MPESLRPHVASTAAEDSPGAALHVARMTSWRRAAALFTASCVFVGLGFALGSFLKRQEPAAGDATRALKIDPASADGANARAGAAASGMASPVCASPASSLKLVATTGKKASPSSPLRADPPPRADAAKRFLSPVRDPGF